MRKRSILSRLHLLNLFYALVLARGATPSALVALPDLNQPSASIPESQDPSSPPSDEEERPIPGSAGLPPGWSWQFTPEGALFWNDDSDL